MTENNNQVEEVIVETIDNVADAIIELVDIASNFAKLFVRTRTQTVTNITNVASDTTDYIVQLTDKAKDFGTKCDDFIKKACVNYGTVSSTSTFADVTPAPGGLSTEEALQKIEELQIKLVNGGYLSFSQSIALEALLAWKADNGL